MNNPILSIDFVDYKSNTHLCCIGLKYNLPLSDVVNELNRTLELKSDSYKIVNKFNQKIPLNYKIRCDITVYLSFLNV